MNNVSCVNHLTSVKGVTNVPTVAYSRSTCRGQIASVFGKIGSPGGQSQSYYSPQGRLHPPLPVPAKFDQVTQKLLCKSPQEPLPGGGIASTFEKKCSITGNKSEILGFYNRLVLVP